MVEFVSWLKDWSTVLVAGIAVCVSLALGIPALVRAGRAEGRAKTAEERAERAEKRADRIESRETERHAVEWTVRFRKGDVTFLDATNSGADDAHGVLIVADIDGVKIYEERGLVLGKERETIPLEFKFLKSELARNKSESQILAAQTRGLGFQVLSVTVTVRIDWSTPLGSPRSQTLGPQKWELT